MEYRRLGKRGPELSVVGYGAWEIGGESYGPNPESDEIVAAIRTALDSGINWIDTAEVYGYGLSEELIAGAIVGRRESVIVATKVAPGPVGSGIKPREVRAAAEESLKRLKTDYIDLYQIHWWPANGDYPIEETWASMAELADEGIVRYLGVSNFDREQIERCLSIRHCDSLQPQLSMLHRDDEDLISWCSEQGIGVVVYGPMAYGLLTGSIDANTIFESSDWRSGRQQDHPYYKELFAPGKIENNLEIVEQLRPVASIAGIEIGQLALAWAFHRPGVTAAIAGSRNSGHIRKNAEAGSVKLSEPILEEIDRILSTGS